MNIQFQLFTAFWLFPLFAMRLAMDDMLVVEAPPKLVLIRGGRKG